MARKAVVTLKHTDWSGWNGGSQKTTTGRATVRDGETLSPASLGMSRESYGGSDSLFYEILTGRILEYRVVFGYRKLVINNPNGTINLTAENFGTFVLGLGESKKLSTPTMDGGTGVTVTLESIAEAPAQTAGTDPVSPLEAQ